MYSEITNNQNEIPEVVTTEFIFKRYGINDLDELYLNIFLPEDQKLMSSGEWDYDNPSLRLNEIKDLVEKLDDNTLDEETTAGKKEILYLWNHHAISSAIRKNDQDLAQKFADTALRLQPEMHPNRITKLLQLLVYDKIAEAKAWANGTTDPVEKETGESLIKEYEQGRWF